MNGAQFVAQYLKAQGVGQVFTVPGFTINPLYAAFDDAGIKLVETRSETAAAYMADAWTRATGEPAVCAVTATIAHSLMLAGLVSSYHAGSPVIAISGYAVTADQYDRHELHELDQ
ncbi:MAG: thiamine pyrophosphate-binding protein, partial [Dehalococcoidia bacterium]|nr:thiamine pyrophosphate-binding protein [Dehalococcoidia bacterium]